MSDRKYPPLAAKLGRVVRNPERKELGGKPVVAFSISSNLSYDQNDTQWINVVVWNEKNFDKAMALSKGDRVVVEGNLKETQGTGKTFYDLSAFAIFRATDVSAADDDDL